MCLEFIFIKVIHWFPIYYGIFVSMAMAVMGQLHSPCPETFQYDRYQNGELYGEIKVYADQNVVDLNVELSVANRIEGEYEGFINLTMPGSQASENIREGRPIQYGLYFPPGTGQITRVTRIAVNGRTVCSGNPFERSRKTPLVSNVRLYNKFSVKKVVAEGSQNEGQNQSIDLEKYNTLFGISTTKRTTTVNGGALPWETSNEEDNLSAQVTKRPTPSPPKLTPIQPKPPTPTQLNPPLPTRPKPPPTQPKPTPTQLTPMPTSPKIDNKSPLSTENTCGKSLAPNPLLIINEGLAPAGTFPWLAAIFLPTRRGADYKCCGSLVSQKHVITAAHCLQKDRQKISPISADSFFFIFGKHTIDTIFVEDGEKGIRGKEIKTHPDYVPLSSDADIAVVILAQEIEYTDFIRPICIWSESDDIEAIVGKDGKVVWWENEDEDNPEPRQAIIKVVSQKQCAKSPRSFCAGGESHADACNGNSGSGFVMERHGRWNLRGIVSITTNDADRQSCDSNKYVVYTDVSKFRKWLLSIITI